MKKILLLINLIMICLLTSCGDFSDLKNLSFCFGIGFDYSDTDKYSVTFENAVLENSNGDASYEYKIHETTGNSFEDALSNLMATTTGLIDISHCHIIVFNNEISGDDLEKLITDLLNNFSMQNDTLLLISKDAKAVDIFKSKAQTTPSVSTEINHAIKMEHFNYGKTFKKNLTELYNDYKTEYDSFIIPSVAIKKNGDEETTYLNGGFIFKDSNIVSHIEDNDIINALMIKKLITKATYRFKYNDDELSFSLTNIKPKIKVQVNNAFDFKIKLSMDVEIFTTIKDSTDLLHSFEDYLEDEINRTFNENKEEDIDVYRLSLFLYRHENKILKKNKDKAKVSNYNIEIDVKTNLKNKGVIK